MEVIGTVVSGLFGSALGGGGIGLLGTLVGKVFGWLEVREKTKLAAVQNAHELALVDKQSQMKQAEMESEMMIATMSADTAVRTAAYDHDASYGETPRWCSAVLRLVRPIITCFLLGLTSWIYYKAYAMGEIDTLQMLADEIVFMTSLCVTFWFGSRPMNRR